MDHALDTPTQLDLGLHEQPNVAYWNLLTGDPLEPLRHLFPDARCYTIQSALRPLGAGYRPI